MQHARTGLYSVRSIPKVWHGRGYLGSEFRIGPSLQMARNLVAQILMDDRRTKYQNRGARLGGDCSPAGAQVSYSPNSISVRQ
jgi:hypothetical protein